MTMMMMKEKLGKDVETERGIGKEGKNVKKNWLRCKRHLSLSVQGRNISGFAN